MLDKPDRKVPKNQEHIIERKLEELIQDYFDRRINIVDCDNFLFELICSIDGAVILDYKFNISSAGKMFSNKSTKIRKKYRGTRTIAAISLSRFGLSIKIYEDGEILIVENEEELVRI
ncbi:diadenylate cyclase [Bacillus arachidis]|uniref:diadenylate cyclase n=1 Tax=Bacillus arachidis TaxID=2819290 RepID=UPI00255CBB39|nr:diadenylate cyclase [Bacillus arachidis]WIY62164.1 diadenylate cyclase [Bacillus arachidis]